MSGPVTCAIQAMRTEPEPPRRGFLRGLLSLPLIGGGLALVGSPSAVAETCTDATLDNYVAWLAHEHREALVERTLRAAVEIEPHSSGLAPRSGYLNEVRERTRSHPPMFWFPDAPAIQRLVSGAQPSTRAALVLSTLGADWRR